MVSVIGRDAMTTQEKLQSDQAGDMRAPVLSTGNPLTEMGGWAYWWVGGWVGGWEDEGGGGGGGWKKEKELQREKR